MTAIWPRNQLVPRRTSVDLKFKSTQGVIAIGGFRQVIGSDAGTWVIGFSDIRLLGRTDILKWNELAMALEGRLNPVLVPVCGRIPRPPRAFADGTGYVPALPFAATVAATVALRSTTAQIAISHGGPIEPGMYFSIGERLYCVRAINSVVGSVTTVSFRPPAREAHAAGAAVDFTTPHCKCQLSEDSMPLDLDLLKRGSPSISFVESAV
jgi:hypothetical protein